MFGYKKIVRKSVIKKKFDNHVTIFVKLIYRKLISYLQSFQNWFGLQVLVLQDISKSFHLCRDYESRFLRLDYIQSHKQLFQDPSLLDGTHNFKLVERKLSHRGHSKSTSLQLANTHNHRQTVLDRHPST